MKKIFWICLLMICCAQSRAQQKALQLEGFYTGLHSQGMLNGQVLLAEKGRIIFQKAYGYANFEKRQLNTLHTGFQLASLSKPFTAIAVLQLYEQGKIGLSEPLSRYIPEFPYPEISILQLLSHSSGLSDQALGPELTAFEKRNGHTHDNQELLQFLAGQDQKFELAPGEKWWYANTGFELLACLVERVSVENFADYLQKHITGPAGMDHTYLSVSENSRRPEQSRNYDYRKRYSIKKERVDQAADYTGRSYGHSNLVSTCQDLLKLSTAYFSGKLLKAETVKLALAGTTLKNGQPNAVWLNIGGLGKTVNGLGWFIFTDPDQRGQLFHAGGMSGAVTILMYDVSKQQTVIVLDNTGSEGIYRNAQNGLRILNGQAVIPAKRNLSKMYGRCLVGKGAAAAKKLLLRLRPDTLHYNLSENDMNNLGYALLEDKFVSRALEVFKVNCGLFPQSDNAMNSYGEALERNGQPEQAQELYKKSLSLNPANEDSKKALERLTQK